MKKSVLIEVSIVLVLIVIVAILVLPKMFKNIEKLCMATQLRRTFNVASIPLQDFLKNRNYKTIYATKEFNKKLTSSTEDLEKLVQGYFKATKICTSKTPGGIKACTADVYNGLIDGKPYGNFSGDVCAIIKSGASLCFNRISSPNAKSVLYMDVNGPKGPNNWGRDAYRFRYDIYGKLAEMYTEDINIDLYEFCGQDQYGTGCYTKMNAETWAMDY